MALKKGVVPCAFAMYKLLCSTLFVMPGSDTPYNYTNMLIELNRRENPEQEGVSDHVQTLSILYLARSELTIFSPEHRVHGEIRLWGS